MPLLFISQSCANAVPSDIELLIPYSFSGAVCQPRFGEESIQYGEFGAANRSDRGPADVMCPLMINTASLMTELKGVPKATSSVRIEEISIAYIDNHRSSEFLCSPWQAETPTFPGPNGTVTWAGNRFTCHSLGGCISPTSDTIGGGDLTWTLPFGAGSVKGFQDIGVFCVIPPLAPDGSWITSVRVTLRIYQGIS